MVIYGLLGDIVTSQTLILINEIRVDMLMKKKEKKAEADRSGGRAASKAQLQEAQHCTLHG
jgi:hypothetical protein